MVRKANGIFAELITACVRILIIFIILCTSFDSLTRLYYSYMPLHTWIDFKSVRVEMHNGEAMAVLTRRPNARAISTLHRTLLISYPDNLRGCTATTVTVLDQSLDDVVYVPMSRMLAQGCEQTLDGQTINGTLQVSYIFDFPYGIKRYAIQYSNDFSLSFNGADFVVGEPIAHSSGTPPSQ